MTRQDAECLALSALMFAICVAIMYPAPDMFGLVDSGSTLRVQQVLASSKAYANVKDKEHGKTPLHRAAERGHTEIAALLLEAKAEVDAKDKYGETPLHYAAQRQHTDAARLLLKKMADPNVKDAAGRTPLIMSAENGHSNIATMLLEAKADANVKDKEHGKTPLHRAAERGHTEIAALLLEAKAEVDAKDKYGETPLHYAMQMCLQIGQRVTFAIDSSSADFSGCPGRLSFFKGQSVRVSKIQGGCFLPDDFSTLWAPIAAAKVRGFCAETAKLLLEAGNAAGNVKDSRGKTLLHRFAANQNTNAAELLLETGKADVEVKDSAGRTPLFIAAAEGDREMCKLLLEVGKADADVKDSAGKPLQFVSGTSLHQAAEGGDADLVRLLLKLGKADANVKDKEHGKTPLHHAAERGHTEIAKLLLEADAGVDASRRDKYGETPLHYAAQEGHSETVELLLETGKAAVDVVNKQGKTPLDRAKEADVLRLLMQAAASSGDELAKLVVDLGLAPSTYAAGISWIMNEGGTSLQDIIDANLVDEFASSLDLGRVGAYKLRVRLEALGMADKQEMK